MYAPHTLFHARFCPVAPVLKKKYKGCGGAAMREWRGAALLVRWGWQVRQPPAAAEAPPAAAQRGADGPGRRAPRAGGGLRRPGLGWWWQWRDAPAVSLWGD